MATTVHESPEDWKDLKPGPRARALAGAGVLAALLATPARTPPSGARPRDFASLLRDYLDRQALTESPLLEWALPVDRNRRPLPWLPLPGALAHVWQQALEARDAKFRNRIVTRGDGYDIPGPAPTGFRLELPPEFEELGAATRALVNAHTNIESLASLVPGRPSRLEWNWPLRFRLLVAPRHAPGLLDPLREYLLSGRNWLPAQVEVLADDDDDTRADIALVFSATPSDAQAYLRDAVPHADCLVLLTATRPGSGDAGMDEAPVQVPSPRRTASGVLLQAGMLPDDNQTFLWLTEFIRELSHALTVDVAAMRAASRVNVDPPRMRLSRALLTHAHVSRRQGLLQSQLKRLDPLQVISIPDAASRMLQLPPTVTIQRLTEAFQARVTPFDFDSEGSGASAVSGVETALRSLPASPAPPAPLPRGSARSAGSLGFGAEAPRVLVERRPHPASGPRFLQAQLRSFSPDGDVLTRFKALAPRSYCLIRVRIGAEDLTWPRFSRTAFPTDQLPPTSSGWLLQVHVFTNAGEPPQSTTLFLPAEGDSAACEFRCRVGDESGPFRARVVVAYGNRVLQSAWLEEPVMGESGRARGRRARGIEVVVRPTLDGLDARSQFGAFMVLNDSLTQGPGVAIASGPMAVLRTPQGLSNTIAFIDGELSKIGDEPQKYAAGLESKAVARILRSMAQYGREMYEAIVLDQEVDDRLRAADRVQVVAAQASSRLPIEFFYDLPSPGPEAPLCPGAAKCLTGPADWASLPCNDLCPPAATGKQLVCPRGFWGLRKVIEWHRHGGQNKVHEGDFLLQSEPDANRPGIAAFRSVLFAHSDQVDAYNPQASADVLAALKKASGTTNTASDWDAWRAGINDFSPLLLVVLPHNVASSNGLPELTIGPGTQAHHRLLLGQIDDEVVKGPKTIPGAIVMLLGCETGAPRTAYLDYVAKFRRYGASIILSTGSIVLGRHISPICVQLVEGLRAAVADGPAPLGEVMLRLRRSALAAGFPVVLALNASGDADWLIEHGT